MESMTRDKNIPEALSTLFGYYEACGKPKSVDSTTTKKGKPHQQRIESSKVWNKGGTLTSENVNVYMQSLNARTRLNEQIQKKRAEEFKLKKQKAYEKRLSQFNTAENILKFHGYDVEKACQRKSGRKHEFLS